MVGKDDGVYRVCLFFEEDCLRMVCIIQCGCECICMQMWLMYLFSRLMENRIMFIRKKVMVNSVKMLLIFVLISMWCSMIRMNSVVDVNDRLMFSSEKNCSGISEKLVIRLKFRWIRLQKEYFDLLVECFLCFIMILVGLCEKVQVRVGMKVLILWYWLIRLMMLWLQVCSMLF